MYLKLDILVPKVRQLQAAVADRCSTLDAAWKLWHEMLEDAHVTPMMGTYNAMFNCIAKNAAVSATGFEQARGLSC